MLYRFADIILPIAFRGYLTYSVPEELSGIILTGSRVLVPLQNNKVCTGIVAHLHNNEPTFNKIKSIISCVDNEPLINERQLKLWRWISEYYMCSEGEVMKAAIPSLLLPEGLPGTKPEGGYRPKTLTCYKLNESIDNQKLQELLDKLVKAPRQYDTMMALLHLSEEDREAVPVSRLMIEKGVSASAISTLRNKNIIEQIEVPVDRTGISDSTPKVQPKQLSILQQKALDEIKACFQNKGVVLLHGVTSSGKTEIYIHLIEEQLRLGKQVLYLLPEIALTSQIVDRMMLHFGSATGVYHSKFNEQEKVEIWNKVAESDNGYSLIIGVRSSLFLPFSKLGLVIIDEEHDTSYKQQDPAPRYNGRDTASVLASIHNASCLMGSASPSIESYFNALNGKYGLVEIRERFGAIKLPEIIIADSHEAARKKLMVSHFTPQLLSAMDDALCRNEQIILFRNRRGFSPYIQCPECGWIPVCNKCSVNLTYHKGINRLVCHYCGYSIQPSDTCGSCGSKGLATRGFGTEKLEDEIKIVFPTARVARLDQDTTGSKNAFNRIIKSFEQQRIDILIGTQMIAKGLDFENLTVVGILNADNMLNFPDFRAHERSFQLMSQVSGRAGRRQKQGRVIIQTNDPLNPVIRMVIRHDYSSLFKSQTEERLSFNYPPYCRMIRITLKHKDRSLLNGFAATLADQLRLDLGNRVLGPEYPVISMVQLWYIKNILLKIEKEKPVAFARKIISNAVDSVEKMSGAGGLRINVDVDPY